jgi:hypothetical protein
MDVYDKAIIRVERVVLKSIASKLAPTGFLAFDSGLEVV